jgi:hypothetical protein
MRAFEFLTEEMKTIGREFNHLEDLVFSEPNGAQRAVEVLKSMEQDARDLSVKWDGNPTVYWGRDEDGTFRMVGKNNWGREEGKSSSPEELEKFILSRGKGEDWREKFAKDMADLWPIFEAATPKDYRGYVYADLLYHPGKPYEGKDGKISFTPNQTTYNVKATSDVGKKIGKSKVGVAAHSELEYFGDKGGSPIKDVDQFNTNDLVVFGQTYVTHQPAVDADNIDSIAKLANDYQGKINQFFAKQKGLSDLQDIVYRYLNQTSRAKQLEGLSVDQFMTWLESSNVSANKQIKINELAKANADTINAVFVLIKEIMKAKDEIIRELDSAEGDITATTGGTPGGEGYVKMKDKVKLVPRDRWQPFRSE